MAKTQGKPKNSSPQEPINVWQFVFRLLKSPRDLAVAVFVVLLFLVPIVGITRVAGYDLICLGITGWNTRACEIEASRSPETGKSPLADCIALGRKHGRSYVIQSLTHLIRLEERPAAGGGVERVSETRIVYSMLPLEDIPETKPVFIESYQSKGTSLRWWGSESESSSNVSSYTVPFQTKHWQPRTVVTGVRHVAPMPRDGDVYFHGQVTISEGEDAEAYSNQVDVICELTMLIEAPGMNLEPVLKGAKRAGGETIEASDAHVRGPSGTLEGEAGPGNINARWENVLPGESVGIVYRNER